MNDELIWKALSDPTRRKILDLLRVERRTTGDLVGQFEHLTRYGVMKHLSVLDKAGLINVHREGKFRWNTLNVAPIQHIVERWIRPYEQHWVNQMSGLKNFIDKGR